MAFTWQGQDLIVGILHADCHIFTTFWFTKFGFVLPTVHDLWKFSMYFLKSTNIKKLKGMMCMSNANTQNRFKTILWLEVLIFFLLLLINIFLKLVELVQHHFFSPIWKLRLLVLWGKLALTCNFFSDSSSSDHIGGIWRGFDTAQKLIMCYTKWMQVFSSLKLLHQSQVQTVIRQEINCWNYFGVEWSCRNEERFKARDLRKNL